MAAMSCSARVKHLLTTDESHTMADMNDTDLDHHAENALHAAQTLISRLGADHTAVVVVTIAPTASVGIWQHGNQNIGVLPSIGDAECEVCEAAAPLVQGMLDKITQAGRDAALTRVAGGARLQLLLIPSASDLALRLIANGESIVLGARQVGTVV